MSTDPTWTEWHKATKSGGNGGDCVEVRESATLRQVRDSKNPDGPALTFDAEAWNAFLAEVKADRLG